MDSIGNGFIKTHRKIQDWEWYTDGPTFRVFFHCLINANYHEQKWKGQLIKRGSWATSVIKIADKLGLSRQKVRTALDKLVVTNNITIKTTNRFTIISINNYDKYQLSNQQSNHQATNKNSGILCESEENTENCNQQSNQQKNGRYEDISYKNYSEKITSNQQSNNQITIKQPSNNHQVTTTNKYKEIKEIKNNNNYIVEIEEIITHLNQKASTKYKVTTEKTCSLIRSRLNENFTVEDFKKVIDNKCNEWLNTQMEKYLRPETLFCAKHFESYLNQKVKTQSVNNSKSSDIELPDWYTSSITQIN